MEVLTAEPLDSRSHAGFPLSVAGSRPGNRSARRGSLGQSQSANRSSFPDLAEALTAELKTWLKAGGQHRRSRAQEPSTLQAHRPKPGRLLRRNGRTLPERSLIDLRLTTEELEVHTEGMVRVAHPGHGMGVEFPSRTVEQRAAGGQSDQLLAPMSGDDAGTRYSPRALVADRANFESADQPTGKCAEDLEDPLLELLRRAPRCSRMNSSPN